MNKGFTLVIFAAGAAVGSVITWHFLRTKYEELAQEDLESRRRYEKTDEEKRIIAKQAIEKPDVTEFSSILRSNGYNNKTNYSNPEKIEDRDISDYEEDDDSKAFVISEDEFGTEDDFEIVSLIYYSDAVLADENNELVEDVEKTIGSDILRAFEINQEEDVIYVRNPATKYDYEIARAVRKYTDVLVQEGRSSPSDMED